MAEYIIKAADWAIDHNGESLYKGCEKIVRCRDCKHYVEDPNPIDPGWPMMCADSGRDMIEPYGFCAWGERKEDGDVQPKHA